MFFTTVSALYNSQADAVDCFVTVRAGARPLQLPFGVDVFAAAVFFVCSGTEQTDYRDDQHHLTVAKVVEYRANCSP